MWDNTDKKSQKVQKWVQKRRHTIDKIICEKPGGSKHSFKVLASGWILLSSESRIKQVWLKHLVLHSLSTNSFWYQIFLQFILVSNIANMHVDNMLLLSGSFEFRAICGYPGVGAHACCKWHAFRECLLHHLGPYIAYVQKPFFKIMQTGWVWIVLCLAFFPELALNLNAHKYLNYLKYLFQVNKIWILAI